MSKEYIKRNESIVEMLNDIDAVLRKHNIAIIAAEENGTIEIAMNGDSYPFTTIYHGSRHLEALPIGCRHKLKDEYGPINPC